MSALPPIVLKKSKLGWLEFSFEAPLSRFLKIEYAAVLRDDAFKANLRKMKVYALFQDMPAEGF